MCCHICSFNTVSKGPEGRPKKISQWSQCHSVDTRLFCCRCATSASRNVVTRSGRCAGIHNLSFHSMAGCSRLAALDLPRGRQAQPSGIGPGPHPAQGRAATCARAGAAAGGVARRGRGRKISLARKETEGRRSLGGTPPSPPSPSPIKGEILGRDLGAGCPDLHLHPPASARSCAPPRPPPLLPALSSAPRSGAACA